MSATTSRFDSADDVPPDGGIDLDATLRRLGGDAALMRDLARIVVEDAPPLLAQTLTGLESKDRNDAALSAHALKGLLGNFSAAAASAAQSAESALRQGDAARRTNALAKLQTYVARLLGELRRTVLSGQ